MTHDLFTSTAHLWTARSPDPSEAFMAPAVADAPEDAPIALLGIPYDGAVPGRPGARGGPDAIRAQMGKLRPWSHATGAFTPGVRDWGNVRVPYGTVDDVAGAVEAATRAVLDAGAFPLALGGDHSVTWPLVKAHEGRVGKLGVINLDAHLDVRDVVGGVRNSGQSFGQLVDLGLVPAENLVEVGIRDFANAPTYVEKVEKTGGTVITAAEWREQGREAIARAVATAADGVDAVYLSVDVDVLDQAFAPGVSAPTPGGPDTTALYEAIRTIARHAPLAGADFVEVAPALDVADVTSRAAAYGVMELLAGLAARGGR